MAQAVGEFREVALEVGEVEQRNRFIVSRPYQPGSLGAVGWRPRPGGGTLLGDRRVVTMLLLGAFAGSRELN
jgi:hypothetical protein